jgi:hypothetical protein
MSQQLARQAARRSALDAQAVLRKERADRERRLEALAVAVLTALGERDALVRDAEQRAGEALRSMTDDEGLSKLSLRLRRTGSPRPRRLASSSAASQWLRRSTIALRRTASGSSSHVLSLSSGGRPRPTLCHAKVSRSTGRPRP